jgi:hypothetical protein
MPDRRVSDAACRGVIVIVATWMDGVGSVSGEMGSGECMLDGRLERAEMSKAGTWNETDGVCSA